MAGLKVTIFVSLELHCGCAWRATLGGRLELFSQYFTMRFKMIDKGWG